MSELVSVALCTYNGEKHLARQLDSLIHQSYPNLEVVITDDGSTDGTVAIIESYGRRLPIRFYQNPRNLGYTKNFEAAISRCRGELIALCDQDDEWLPEKIETLVRLMGNNLLVYGDSELIDEEGADLGQTVAGLKNFVRGSNSTPFLLHNCVSGHAMLFRKGLLQYALPFPNGFYHDWWLTYAAATVGSIDYCDRVLVKYRQHAQSSTNIRSRGQKESVGMKTDRIVDRLQLFRQFNAAHGCDTSLLDKLLHGYRRRRHAFFSGSLFRQLLAHRQELYRIPKKPDYKRWHSAFKESVGRRLK